MCRMSRPVLAVLPLAVLAACSSPPTPVGVLSAEPTTFSLPHAGWERVRLDWTMMEPLPDLEGELRVSLHLIAGGELLRTFDHAFPGDWVPGEERAYEVAVFQSALAPPLAVGEYVLRAGLYDTAGHHWPVDGEGEPGNQIAEVTVGEPGADFPELSFSADWLPTEEGTDRQILARRWLAGDGAIRVRGIAAAGALWLRVGIPNAGERQEMVLDEGSAQPVATVRADCSEFVAELDGGGSHTLEIPLAAAAAECQILFSTNYELVSTENDEKRTIALENLAWTAD